MTPHSISCVERDIVYDTLTAPHQTPIYPDQLLSRHAVGFIEHASNFVVIVLADRVDDAFELVTYIQLVCIEQQQDQVRPVCKPLGDISKVVWSDE